MISFSHPNAEPWLPINLPQKFRNTKFVLCKHDKRPNSAYFSNSFTSGLFVQVFLNQFYFLFYFCYLTVFAFHLCTCASAWKWTQKRLSPFWMFFSGSFHTFMQESNFRANKSACPAVFIQYDKYSNMNSFKLLVMSPEWLTLMNVHV